MSRGRVLGAAFVVIVLAVCTAVAVLGAPKPPVYVSHGDPLAGKIIYQAPSPPTALIVGDSYAAGSGATAPDQSFAHTVAYRMGWVANVDAQGGTGFVNNGHQQNPTNVPYPDRLAADKSHYLADYVIVTGGRNDNSEPADQVDAALTSYLTALKQAFPKARMVIVAPFWDTGTPPAALLTLRDEERAEAASLHAAFIDPLAEHWYTDQNRAMYTLAGDVHPNQAGHDYIAARLAADLHAEGL